MSRDAILDAALRVLAREGTTDAALVAREAGVSKALVFHHFDGIAGLRDGMAERILAGTQEGLDAFARDYPNPRERIEAFVRALLSEPPEPPRAMRHVVRFWLEDDRTGAARGAARDAIVGDFLRATLKEMRWSGDARAGASMLLARWHGATVAYATGTPVDFDAEAERALAQLEAR